MKIEMNGTEIEMDERIENVSVYFDGFDGSVRYTSFEIWASDPTGWTDDVLVSVIEMRNVSTAEYVPLVIDGSWANGVKSLGDYGYNVR